MTYKNSHEVSGQGRLDRWFLRWGAAFQQERVVEVGPLSKEFSGVAQFWTARAATLGPFRPQPMREAAEEGMLFAAVCGASVLGFVVWKPALQQPRIVHLVIDAGRSSKQVGRRLLSAVQASAEARAMEKQLRSVGVGPAHEVEVAVQPV